MIRLNRVALFLFVVVASIWAPRPLLAQDASKPKSAHIEISSSDSASIAEIQKAADDLAKAVQEAVRKITEDPAVKVAALKVAKSAVTTAQVTITEQADSLSKILDQLARDIAKATDTQSSKSKDH
ncbi:MAG TPA: hypothetical protein VF042_12370 [Gemmatimonadaceae bacterium]